MRMRYRLWFLTVILSWTITAHATPTYRIQTEDFAPYAYRLPDGSIDGMSVEIVSWMLNDLDIHTDIMMLPWVRGIKNTRTKDWHVLFSVARTAERETWFQWVGPFYSDQIQLYRMKNASDKRPSLEAVKENGLILVSRGYPEEKLLTEQGFKRLAYTADANMSLKMLIGQRAQYLAIGQAALPCLLAKNGVSMDQLEPIGISIFSTELYIAMSPRTPASEVARWQRSLDKLKGTPRYWQIITDTRHCQ